MTQRSRNTLRFALVCFGFLTRVPLSHARPDVAAFASLCASDKKEDVDGTAVSAMNKTLARLKDTADLALSYPALDVVKDFGLVKLTT
jgi:hypothetical protein